MAVEGLLGLKLAINRLNEYLRLVHEFVLNVSS